jgi:hypothetical protein
MMKPYLRALLFFVLPIIAVMSYPPEWLMSAIGVVIVALAFFIFLGIMLMRGRHLALTFSIFVQGFNVIIRLMMFFPNGISSHGVYDYVYIVTCLIGLILSLWLLLRLDHDDVRLLMTQ